MSTANLPRHEAPFEALNPTPIGQEVPGQPVRLTSPPTPEAEPSRSLARFRQHKLVRRRSRQSPRDNLIVYPTIKRILDTLIASLAIVVLSPILILAALTVRLTSRGPVFYRQARCGTDGRSFKVWKFRSMVQKADERIAEMVELATIGAIDTVDAPAFKSRHDPRITRVGRILRRTCVDELPQLLNVMKGDMSLVGPRPLVWPEAETLSAEEFRQRHRVRPGITCTWQVVRDEETTFSERIALDLHYVRNGSIVYDLRLLLATPIALIFGGGAH